VFKKRNNFNGIRISTKISCSQVLISRSIIIRAPHRLRAPNYYLATASLFFNALFSLYERNNRTFMEFFLRSINNIDWPHQLLLPRAFQGRNNMYQLTTITYYYLLLLLTTTALLLGQVDYIVACSYFTYYKETL